MDEAGVATDARAATYAEGPSPSEERNGSRQSEAMHTSRDDWGPCCSGCEYAGQPYKPCGDGCTDWKEALR